MKTRINQLTFLLTAILISLISYNSSAQEKKSNSEEIKIHTSAVCGMCKDRIEHDMAFEKGVKSVVLDSETKIATIGYNPKKTDPEKLRTAITKIGYDADDMPADPVAYGKLPACCKKDQEPH